MVMFGCRWLLTKSRDLHLTIVRVLLLVLRYLCWTVSQGRTVSMNSKRLQSAVTRVKVYVVLKTL